MSEAQHALVDAHSVAAFVPPGGYYAMRVQLPSERSLVVLIPYAVRPGEASSIASELRDLSELVAKW